MYSITYNTITVFSIYSLTMNSFLVFYFPSFFFEIHFSLIQLPVKSNQRQQNWHVFVVSLPSTRLFFINKPLQYKQNALYHDINYP